MLNHSRTEFIERYHSTHYHSIGPKTRAEWEWVIERLEMNFGKFLEPLPRTSHLADLACGVGYLEDFLLRGGFRRIDAVDLSEEQIAAAVDNMSRCGHDYRGKVEFKIQDAFEYLEENRNLDGVALIDLLEHFDKERAIALLNSARAALTPGGFLMLRTPNAAQPMFGRFYNDFTHETPFTQSSLNQCLAVAGFESWQVTYEERPSPGGGWQRSVKRKVKSMGWKLLGKLLGMDAREFSEDLVAIAIR